VGAVSEAERGAEAYRKEHPQFAAKIDAVLAPARRLLDEMRRDLDDLEARIKEDDEQARR